MLTAIDIHYLVGLLTRVSNAEDIEIELGNMVNDIAAEENRDVDITIIKKNPDGTLNEYRGVEVKKHGRPLTVEHVEQLCMKFYDLPSITHKAIVSASGYSKGAQKKAKRHGVELLEIRECKEPIKGFKHVQFQKGCFKIIENILSWDGTPVATANFDQQDFDKIESNIDGGSQVLDSNGKTHLGISNLSELRIKIIHGILTAQIQTDTIRVGELKEISIYVPLVNEQKFYVLVGDKSFPIKGFSVKGVIKSNPIEHKPEFKILKNINEEKPLAACAIFELSNGHLSGFAVNNSNTNISQLNIPFSDRLKKIRKHKLV